MTGPTSRIDDELWSAVGDPTRRHLIDLLVGGGPATATSLSRQLPVTRQAVTKHLQVLEGVELIRSSQVGRERRYSIEEDRLARATAVLAGVAEAWDARLQRIKSIAEAIEAERAD